MIVPPGSGQEPLASLYSQPVVRLTSASDLVTTPPCEVCGTCSARPVYVLPGTPYLTVECPVCRLGSLFPRPAPEEIARFYPPHYYGGAGRKFHGLIEVPVRLVGARHTRFLARQFPPGGRILDMGCGRGVTLQALLDAGFEAHGFEVSADAVQGLDSRIQVHLAGSLVEARFEAATFDGVILWHVLEHVPRPRQTLEEIHRILRPGGTLIVAVPNASSWQAQWTGPAWFHLDPPRHLFHFPLPALKQLLASTGFECRSEHHFSLRQNPFGWIQSALNLLPVLPRNILYELLHHRPDSGRVTHHWTWHGRLLLWFLMLALAPPALALSVLAALCRRGATVHLVTRRL